MLKVSKFGGSSVASAEQFRKVKAIVESDPERRVVVVSAAGKRNSQDSKMTDLLYLTKAHYKYGVDCTHILNQIRDRFVEIRNDLGLSYDVGLEFEMFASRLNKEFPEDELVSRGEYFTARLMAEYLGYGFVDAADCLYFSYDGKIDKKKTYAAISKAVEDNGRVVIPGFYGIMPDSSIRVLTRGGGDVTGAIAAAAIGANVYENWTDVSGILMADPRIVKNPQPIERITYDELQALAAMGASVLHQDAVAPVKEAGIPLNIRNTNDPSAPGTMIVEKVEEEKNHEKFITGLAGKKNYTILTIYKDELKNAVTLRKTLEILDKYNIYAEHITLGMNSFSVVVPSEPLEKRMYDVLAEIKTSCAADDVKVRDHIALVAVVGRRMGHRPGVSGKLFNALGANGVNVRTIKQGADELTIVIGVENEKFDTTIRVLHDEFAG